MAPWPDGLALILDLDGVIVDSAAVHAACWREYLRRCGLEVPEARARKMFGWRNDHIVPEFFGPHLTPAEIARHGAAKEALYRQMVKPQLKAHLVPGVAEFLERRRDAPLGLASNAEAQNVELVLRSAGLRRYFRVVLDGNQVERPKPDPQIYLRAARLLRVPPGNCIVFEDSFSGVAAARAAGARVVGVGTTHAALPDADVNVRDFLQPELEAWLEMQRPSAV